MRKTGLNRLAFLAFTLCVLAMLSTSALAQFLDSKELNNIGSTSIQATTFSISVSQDNGDKVNFFVPRDREDSRSGKTDVRYRIMNLTPGSQYGINFQKTAQSRRFMICVAIDGRNIHGAGEVNGDWALRSTWVASQGSCYVIEGTQTIDSWSAKDNASIGARFKVTDFASSVAGKFGDDGAKSTIVIAVFAEDEPPALADNARSRGATRGGSRGGDGSRDLGTGLGERTEQKVTTVSFTARPTAVEVIKIKYQTKASLIKAGYKFSDNRAW